MLGDEAIVKLRRTLSDADTPVPLGHVTPPSSPGSLAHLTRSARAFSWSKLTESIKGKTRRSSRTSSGASSTSKQPSISGPILDFNSPLCPRTPKDVAGSSSPSSPRFSQSPTAHSSPRSSKSHVAYFTAQHSYSVSDPTCEQSPSHRHRSKIPGRAPPSIPSALSFGSISTLDTSLERIAESPLECNRPIQLIELEIVSKWFGKMDRASLRPPAIGGTKGRAIQQAKDMELLVAERAKRSGDEPPPYDFYELIGKGAYGRVFKGKSRLTGGMVAIKIIDIDKVDYEEMTTKNLSETLKEIDILQQLRDSKARPYVNIIEEARPVHNELWIVSEYASGGSVNTLMKPTMTSKDPGPGLAEKFIVPIARELALGLKYIHEAGVLHRDLKANNVLILEDGRVQLCDFGVSGTLEPQKSKRSTIVGTPFWMAPELQKEWVKDADPHSLMQPKEIQYGNEVDIWAYGCTVYEMACGFPPHHRTMQFDLPNAGVPVLEGDRFSEQLKDFVSFVLQPDPKDRPSPDQILEHPFVANTTKMYPTVTLVKLVEEYYNWEQGGGARASLFNPFGAQAPDPLAPEPEDDDDDWTFSTSDEFEQEHAPQFADPFAVPGQQPFTGMSIPPVQDMGRFEQLQARFKEESIVRGQKRLNKLFDTSTTPYRYSAIDDSEAPSGRPPSDLVLRDFNPGAPNRETVIDLDFSMPSADDIPSIDLGEVPTIKANRMKSLLREMAEEDENDAFNTDNDLTKRATRDWKFPSVDDNADNRKTMEWSFPSEQPNRKTMEWSFPTEQPSNRKTMEWSFAAAQPQKNRRTVEWTFDAAMAEGNYDQPRNRTSRRRETKEWTFPKTNDTRRTQDFSFPMRSPTGSNTEPSSPPFKPAVRHAATVPANDADDFPRVSNSPESPLRTSMIDLDMAMVDDYRPSTSGSDAINTANTVNDNPFNLEDQVQLSQNNHRASYHFQSKSEPNQTVPGLLTPQQQDEQGHPTNQMHARGVSSASQVQGPSKQPIGGAQYHRSNQRSQQSVWDGWSHTHAYGLGSDDQSPPMSVTTDTSLEEEDVDELWDSFERLNMQNQRRFQSYAPLRSSRRTDSASTNTLVNGAFSDTDTDDPYPYSSDSAYDEFPMHNKSLSQTQIQQFRKSRVSAGPNGRPLVEFPIPQAIDTQSLMDMDSDPKMLESLLLKSAIDLRDGTRAARDLLRAMRLEEVVGEDVEGGDESGTERDQSTVRLRQGSTSK